CCPPCLRRSRFSVQKGLFFWSPVLLLAVAGFVVGEPPIARRLRLPAAIVFATQTYLIASWVNWQLGASFGQRGFTDTLPLAAVYIAAFLESVARRPGAVAPAAVVTTMLVALSCAQMVQYWLGILPFADTTWDEYRQLFLRFR